ncbi:unannotated protein [freshwater metagenome]|uniref:Unannotated protein n=1 Tax=freshwater metagenome TaxID=449393 RepID=A0A6J7CNK8_9ZZZZ
MYRDVEGGREELAGSASDGDGIPGVVHIDPGPHLRGRELAGFVEAVMMGAQALDAHGGSDRDEEIDGKQRGQALEQVDHEDRAEAVRDHDHAPLLGQVVEHRAPGRVAMFARASVGRHRLHRLCDRVGDERSAEEREIGPTRLVAGVVDGLGEGLAAKEEVGPVLALLPADRPDPLHFGPRAIGTGEQCLEVVGLEYCVVRAVQGRIALGVESRRERCQPQASGLETTLAVDEDKRHARVHRCPLNHDPPAEASIAIVGARVP